MTKPPATKQMFLRRMLRRVEARGEEVLGIARVDRELGDPNWHLLRRLTALDPAPGLSRYVSRLSGSVLGALPSGEDVQRATALQMNRTAMVREKRGRLLLAIRQTYQVRHAGFTDLGVGLDFIGCRWTAPRWCARGAAACCWPSTRRTRCAGQGLQG